MWTRFNIAEPAVHNMIDAFNHGWKQLDQKIDQLPMHELATSLGFDFDKGYAAQKKIHEQWINDLNTWIGACYPIPEDKKITISSKKCLHGIEKPTIIQAEKDADAMWKEFFYPLLKEFKDHKDFTQEKYDSAYELIKNEVWNTGKAHSFRCEWKFIKDRVRYYELLPTWEIKRIHEDAESEFTKIVEFRQELLKDHSVKPTGIYS